MSEPVHHTPARGRLVVKVKRGAHARQLQSLGRTEAVGKDDLLLVHLPTSTADPKRDWQKVVQSDAVEWAAPVLKDETAAEFVPTGEVTVRFADRPSQAELEHFATANGLQLRDRNEFVAEQAAFRVSKPRETYLPDLVDRLSKKRGVAGAWANTLSHYRRT